MHNLGYAHLDIKPDNFIINDDLGISLIDFGYAYPSELEVNFLVGTKGYLAPEFCPMTTGISGEKADVYSMAITMNKIMKSINKDWSNY